MSWITDVRNQHGDPAVEHTGVRLADRTRSVWVWFIDGVNHYVAVDQHTPSRWAALAGGADGSVTWTGRSEPSDRVIRCLCALVGLLPAPVPSLAGDEAGQVPA